MDIHDADELVRDDPFGGKGLFLPTDGDGEQILAAVGSVFGSVPAVAFPGEGAWINTEGMGLERPEAAARWEKSWTSA